MALAHLQFAEAAHVAQDAVEEIGAADGEERFRVGGVERDPQLIEAGVDQSAAVLVVEHGAVGVEQHVGAAILQIAHHLRQVLHQHRLADAVQHRAFELRDLVDDGREQRPAHVRRRLELGIGARAGRAQEIAAVGRLEIDADRQPFRLLAAPGIDALEIAPRVDSLPGAIAVMTRAFRTPCATARACVRKIGGHQQVIHQRGRVGRAERRQRRIERAALEQFRMQLPQRL